MRQTHRYIVLVFLALISFSMVGCLDGPSGTYKTGDRDRSQDQGKDQDEAEGGIGPESAQANQLLSSALELVTPYTFMEAHELVEKAAQHSPNDGEILFYRHLLAIPMKTKGLLARIDGRLVGRAPAPMVDRYMALVREVRQRPAPLSQFLNAGTTDIYSEADIQDLILQIAGEIDAFRTFLKARANSNKPLRVRFVEYSGLSQSTCNVVRTTPQSLPRLVGCGSMRVNTYNFTRADLEAMSLYAAAWELQTIALSSYEMTGLLDVLRQADEKPMAPSVLINKLFQSPTFGRLRQNQMLANVLNIGSDGVSTLRYAMSVQDQLCRSRSVGSFTELFPRGICLPEHMKDGQRLDALVDAAALALQGQTVSVHFRRDWEWKSTQVQIRDVFAGPRADLRAFVPSEFNPCNDAMDFTDPTLGGVFPQRDAAEVLLNRARSCRSCPCFR